MLLGYRDRNVHELVCHEVAHRSGEYERSGVDVQIVEGRTDPDAPLSAGLGGSLVETLHGRRRWRAVLVHTVHPLFWLWTLAPGTERPLTGRLAAHPEDSIVWLLSRRAIRAGGTDPDRIDVVRLPVGSAGDRDRFRMLERGEVEAAVLGTSHAPAALKRLGFTQHCFFGDVVQFPTAGIAVDTEKIDPEDPMVGRAVAAQRAAIGRIRRGEPVVVDTVMDLLATNDRQDAHEFVRDYLSQGYGVDSSTARMVGAAGAEWLKGELGAVGEAGDFYSSV